MTILLGVILLFAVFTLVVSVIQGVAIVRAAPASENLAGFMPLGWWKFRQLATKAGPAAAEPLNIYKRSVIAFLLFLVLGVILSGWATNQRPTPTASIQGVTLTDPAINSAFSRVATMPGTTFLES